MQAETSATQQSAAGLKPGDLLNEHQAAAILGASVQTLRNWRWKGQQNLRWRKIGRLVRYKRTDLEAFIDGEAA